MGDSFWIVKPPGEYSHFFTSLPLLTDAPSILYFEGCATPPEAQRVFKELLTEPQEDIAKGTLFPKPMRWHIPMTPENLRRVAEAFADGVPAILCDHIHVYTKGKVLLQWFDALCDDPMLVCEDTPEDRVRQFAEAIGTTYERAGVAGR